MKKMLLHILISVFLSWLLLLSSSERMHSMPVAEKNPAMITLPAPKNTDVAIESALRSRRSIRSFAPKGVSLEDIALLLWAAQGLTDKEGKRTAPSAGALYPIEIYMVSGFVTDLGPGVYLYSPRHNSLSLVKEKDQRAALSEASLGQRCVVNAPALIVVAGLYHRTERKYGDRAKRYVHLEAGHVGENVLLQAAALGLGAVVVGAFDDKKVQQVLGLATDHEPLEIIPLGHPID